MDSEPAKCIEGNGNRTVLRLYTFTAANAAGSIAGHFLPCKSPDLNCPGMDIKSTDLDCDVYPPLFAGPRHYGGNRHLFEHNNRRYDDAAIYRSYHWQLDIWQLTGGRWLYSVQCDLENDRYKPLEQPSRPGPLSEGRRQWKIKKQLKP